MSDKDFHSTSRTNWAALESMSDEGIDYSDIPPLTDEFFENATLSIPASHAQQLVHIEPDILRWFQAQEGEYTDLINSVLRHHMESRSEQSSA